MSEIKTYNQIHPERHQLSFDIKRMEDIFEKTKGEPDEPHRHDYYIILCVRKASGKHIIDFYEFELANRQMWFISPGQVHQIIEEKKSFGYALTFTRQFMMENGIDSHFIEDLFLFHDFGYAPPMQLSQAEFEKIEYLAENIRGVVQSETNFKYEAVGAWLKLLLIQSQNFCTIGKESNTQIVQASVTLLKNFKSLLETNHRGWHKVREYADALNVTSDYLNASIKSLTGKNVKEHIQSRIIVAAKRLLRFSNLSNKEIAYELGFSEPANFSQFFKKCTGISPSHFRK